MGFIVDELVRMKISEAVSHRDNRDADVIYVTDLVRCPLKIVYETVYPELAVAGSVSPAAILGDIVHAGLREYIASIVKGFGASVDFEVEGEKTVDIGGRTYRVRGRADAIVLFKDAKVIVEVKTARSDKGIPLEHHKQQLRLYLWLFNADRGILVYITPDRLAEYDVNNAPKDDEVARLVSETVNKSKAPRYYWECSYCQFNIVCPLKSVRD